MNNVYIKIYLKEYWLQCLVVRAPLLDVDSGVDYTPDLAPALALPVAHAVLDHGGEVDGPLRAFVVPVLEDALHFPFAETMLFARGPRLVHGNPSFDPWL